MVILTLVALHNNADLAGNLGKIKRVPYFPGHIINGGAVIGYAAAQYCKVQ
jgi:hypothetical protein